jgi:Zn-dependent protease
MIGWASAPCDPEWTVRYPRRAALMALAGPAGNLILVLLAAAAIRVGVYLNRFTPPDETNFSQITAAVGEGWPATLATLLSIVFMLNLVLLVFNMLPLPPLDGSRLLPAFLGADAGRRYQDFMAQPVVALLGLIVAWRLFDEVFQPIHLLALNLLYPESNYAPK